MNPQPDNTLLQKGDGIVECRICGLTFFPHLQEDRERHEHQHRRILSGGWPYQIREFIKRAAHDVLRHKVEAEGGSASRQQEIAKRALALAWWARAISNGIPENDLEAFMAAHLASLDARQSGDKYQLEQANEAMTKWQKYG